MHKAADQDKTADAAAPEDATRSLYDPAKKSKRSILTRSPIRRREAVLVGINDYIDASVAPLRCCVNDIRAMQQRLEQLGYIVHSLHDEAPTADRKPTRANVTGLLDAVCGRLGRDDMLLVQLSCHGMLVDDRCVLVMMDTWRNRIARDGLPVCQIRDAMKASLARQKVLLLDACHSGVELGKSLPAQAAAAEAAFNRRVLELSEGFAVLSSSAAAQLSQEWRDKRQGLFTYFLLEGLKGHASRDGMVVTVDDIRHYVRREMIRWNEQNPNRPLQEPTAQTEGSGDIVLAELTSDSKTQSTSQKISASEQELLSSAIPQISNPTAPGMSDPTIEVAVACGCDREAQWNTWQTLAPSEGSWLFLLPGQRGEAHDLFLLRLERDRRRAFQGAPPPLFLRVSWPTRHYPPAGLASYRQALAKALHAAGDTDDHLVDRLRRQRQGYHLVLLHPIISRGHCDVDLLEYYGKLWPYLIGASQSPGTLGVKLVQPVEWSPTGWLTRLFAPLLGLWPRPPEVCVRALSIRHAQHLMKKLAARWSGTLNLEVLPELGRISEQQIRQFLRSLDVPPDEQHQLLRELRPLGRESGYILYNLIKQLPGCQERSLRLRSIMNSASDLTYDG